MRKTLTRTFFDRPTLTVAHDLLGKHIVRRSGGKNIALMITEVEAYDGPHDRASHAHRGKTPRNQPMYGKAGHFYVYFTYGMHWLVNIVTGPEGYPAAVLLRGGAYKDKQTGNEVFIKGPALLTRFLNVSGAQNGLLAAKKNGLWFEDRGIKVWRGDIVLGKRIGVDYAGRTWASKNYNLKMENLWTRRKNHVKK